MKKLLLGMFLLFMSASAFSDIDNKLKHKDWTSTVTEPNKSLYPYQAATTKIESNHSVVGMVVSLSADCRSMFYSLIYELNALANVDGIVINGLITSRVDNNSIQTGSWSGIIRNIGDEYMVLVFNLEGDSFLEEMLLGSRLRLKIEDKNESDPIYASISLAGSFNAIDRIVRLCGDANTSDFKDKKDTINF